MDALIGFAGGVGVTLVGALVATALQRKTERRRRRRETEFQVYMKLMDLWQQYFWVASLEIYDEIPRRDVRHTVHDLAWQIADLLRFEDSIDDAAGTLRVLMSTEFATARERHDAMSKLLERMGKRVNPKYQRVVAVLSAENLRRLATSKSPVRDFRTPGSMDTGPTPRVDKAT